MAFNQTRISTAVPSSIIEKIEKVMAAWQVASDADMTARGFTHHLKPEMHGSYAVHYSIGGKYVRFDIGGSGAFMADINTGVIYSIKGYGKVDTKKVIGNFMDENFDAAVLVRDRFRHGRFTNNPDGTVNNAR